MPEVIRSELGSDTLSRVPPPERVVGIMVTMIHLCRDVVTVAVREDDVAHVLMVLLAITDSLREHAEKSYLSGEARGIPDAARGIVQHGGVVLRRKFLVVLNWLVRV